MNVFEIISGVLLLLVALLLIVVVTMQQSKNPGLSGSIGGGEMPDSFYSKNKSRTLDAILGRWTKVLAVIFAVATIVVNVISVFVK